MLVNPTSSYQELLTKAKDWLSTSNKTDVVMEITTDTTQINSFVNYNLMCDALGKEHVHPMTFYSNQDLITSQAARVHAYKIKGYDDLSIPHNYLKRFSQSEAGIDNIYYRLKALALFAKSNDIKNSIVISNLGAIEKYTGFFTQGADDQGALIPLLRFKKSEIIQFAQVQNISQEIIDFSLAKDGGEANYLRWLNTSSVDIERIMTSGDYKNSPIVATIEFAKLKGRNPESLAISYENFVLS